MPAFVPLFGLVGTLVRGCSAERIRLGAWVACAIAASSCSAATADACRDGATQRAFDKCVAACGAASHNRHPADQGGGSSLVGDLLGDVFSRSGGPCVDNCREMYHCHR